MSELNIGLAVAGATVLILGLVAGYVRNRLWLAETLICVLVGMLAGPAVTSLLDFGRVGWSPVPHLLEVARITLGIAVMGAALRLPTRFEVTSWRDLALSLGLGLVLMWLSGAALAVLIIGLPLLPALALGAVLAPTDPVAASSVASGKSAERHLPARLRNLLTAESGANDGLGLLFVLLPVLLLTHPPGEALLDWGIRVLLWEVLGAVAIGTLCGEVSGRLLAWAYRQPFSESHSTITVGLALSITVLTVVRLMGSDGILAVFAAGLRLNRYVEREQTRHEHVQEAIGRFFDLPVFIVFGAMLPWQDWSGLGWAGVGFAGAILALRRLPWWLLLGRPLGAVENRAEAAFLGWFGPIGVATIYYALLVDHRTDLPQIWPAASLVVLASLVAHGVSATPLTTRMGKGP